MESELFKDLDTAIKIKNQTYSELAEKAGIKGTAAGYPTITLDAIVNFLSDKILKDKLLRSNQKIKIEPNRWWNGWGDMFVRVHYVIKEKNFLWGWRTIEKMNLIWEETRISDFAGTPPPNVLESIVKSKKRFDEIRVVTLRYAEKLPFTDPLVVGKFNSGRDDNRYLIDWWDNDIDPSEIEMG